MIQCNKVFLGLFTESYNKVVFRDTYATSHFRSSYEMKSVSTPLLPVLREVLQGFDHGTNTYAAMQCFTKYTSHHATPGVSIVLHSLPYPTPSNAPFSITAMPIPNEHRPMTAQLILRLFPFRQYESIPGSRS